MHTARIASGRVRTSGRRSFERSVRQVDRREWYSVTGAVPDHRDKPTHDTPPIQSLDRGLAILEAVAASPEPMPLKQLTDLIGIDRSSVFRLANTLRQRRFLTNPKGSNAYVLWPTAWRLSRRYGRNVLALFFHQHLRDLATKLGETSHFAVREGGQVFFVDHHTPTGQVISVAGQTGEFAPLHCTAHGKALLADFDRKALKILFGRASLRAYTRNTITSLTTLGRACGRVRTDGLPARRCGVHRRPALHRGADPRSAGRDCRLSRDLLARHTSADEADRPRRRRGRGRGANNQPIPRRLTRSLACGRSVHPEGALVKSAAAALTALVLASPLLALDGDPGMHDPSTIVLHDGKFYAYGTGGGLPISISDDGWTWRRAGSLMQALPGGRPGAEVIARGGNNTWAPDVIRSGDKYFVYYSAPGTQPKAAIGLLVGRTLDPNSPAYKWEDGGPVVWSDGVEDSNAIDPGVFHDPTNGSLWLTYRWYFGYIRLVELDPKTGRRLNPEARPVNLAINGEASIMIFRDGWYTCC